MPHSHIKGCAVAFISYPSSGLPSTPQEASSLSEISFISSLIVINIIIPKMTKLFVIKTHTSLASASRSRKSFVNLKLHVLSLHGRTEVGEQHWSVDAAFVSRGVYWSVWLEFNVGIGFVIGGFRRAIVVDG